MDRRKILKLVKEDAHFKRVGLPGSIKFRLDESAKTIYMEITKPCENMQSDAAAFEGWVLCIKSALSDKVSHFILSWKNKDITKKEFSAYQRFLFRMKRFKEYFGNIISIDSAMDTELKRLLTEKAGNILTLSAPTKDDNRAKGPATGEAAIERDIVSNHMFQLAQTLGIKFVKYNNQFPVGLFLDNPSRKTEIMPARKSAIDLWGVDESGAAHLFELKKENSKKVGIISELLFYSYVFADLQKGDIKYPAENDKKDNCADIIHKSANGRVNVKAHFLVSELHTFITSETIDLINRHLADVDISFSALKYTKSYEFAPYSWTDKK
jgi:hypothetical protein